MAFSVADVDDLLRVLREHPEWRERVRQELLGDELLSLPERTAAVQRQLEVLSEEMSRVARGIETLAQHMDDGFKDLRDAISDLAHRNGGRLDNLDGQMHELRYQAIGRVW